MRIPASPPPSLPATTPAAGPRQPVRAFAEVRKETTAAPPGSAPPLAGDAAPSPAVDMVKGVIERATKAERTMDHRLAEVARGKVYSPQELIALQVEAFRYSQSVEVVSRVTDKVVGGIKQILSIQV
jgi:hypothetical protein